MKHFLEIYPIYFLNFTTKYLKQILFFVVTMVAHRGSLIYEFFLKGDIVIFSGEKNSVPQGSVLEPVLITIYTIVLCEHLSNVMYY